MSDYEIEIENDINLDEYELNDDDDPEIYDQKPKRKEKIQVVEEEDKDIEEEEITETNPTLSKEDLIKKNNLIDYIEAVQSEFKAETKNIKKSNLDELCIQELEAHKDRLMKKILNSSFIDGIDSMIEMGHFSYDMILNKYTNNKFNGLCDMLNENKNIKNAWKLLALERMNMYFKDPSTMLLYNYTMITASCYGMNKIGINPNKMNTKINEDKLKEDFDL